MSKAAFLREYKLVVVGGGGTLFKIPNFPYHLFLYSS